jgi:polar amino acid transport system substrate-binding protein
MLSQSSFNAFATEPVRFGFGFDKPPYVIGRTGEGLEIDIAKAALQVTGLDLKIDFFDKKSLLPALKMKRVDAVASTHDLEHRFCAVPNFIKYQIVAISKAANKISITQIDQLENKHVVAWGEAWKDLGESYRKLFNPESLYRNNDHYFEARDQYSQNAMFWAGRANVIIVDMSTFNWFRHTMANQYPTNKPIVIHKIFPPITRFPVLFNSKSLCYRFKKGLFAIKKNGLYNKLYTDYTKKRLETPYSNIADKIELPNGELTNMTIHAALKPKVLN